jgi:hypothetical protein
VLDGRSVGRVASSKDEAFLGPRAARFGVTDAAALQSLVLEASARTGVPRSREGAG